MSRLSRASLLDAPDASGWWYNVGSFTVRMCYVNTLTDSYSYVGAEIVDCCRRVSIQEGTMWLPMTDRENERMTDKFGTLHL